jgi:DNA-binding transcriptional LysR family regulator
VLDQLDEAETSVRDAKKVPSGVLRVTVSPALGALALAPTIPAFLKAYPRIRLDVVHDVRIVDLVREGYDVGLRLAMTELRESTLVARRIARYRNCFVATPAYLKKHGRPKRPEDLTKHSVLLDTRTSLPETRTFRTPEGPVVVRLEGPFRTDGSFVQRTVALQGFGIAELPEYVIKDDLATGRLVAVLADYEPRPLELWAVWPPAGTRAARVRAFVDYVADALKNEVPA